MPAQVVRRGSAGEVHKPWGHIRRARGRGWWLGWWTWCWRNYLRSPVLNPALWNITFSQQRAFLIEGAQNWQAEEEDRFWTGPRGLPWKRPSTGKLFPGRASKKWAREKWERREGELVERETRADRACGQCTLRWAGGDHVLPGLPCVAYTHRWVTHAGKLWVSPMLRSCLDKRLVFHWVCFECLFCL